VTDLAAWIGAVLVLVLVCRQRPAVWVSVGILTAVLFPVVVTRAWLADAGNIGRVHPSAWVFVIGFVVTLAFSPAKGTVPRIRTVVALAVALWMAATAAIVVRQSGFESVRAFGAYYLAPPLAFLAIHVAVTRGDPGLWKKIVPVVLVAASAESVLALVQFFTHDSVVFERYYMSNYWWTDYLQRSLGTFDSPLDLAAFLTMAIPLTSALRSTPAALLLAGLLTTGVVVSGSRTGVGLAAVAIVWIVFARSSNAIPAILTSLTIVLAAAALLWSPLATTLLGRFGFGGALSTQARVEALPAGIRLAMEDLVGGHGSGYAYKYSRTLLESSFEDAYLATAIDFGLLVAVALIVIQLWATFSGRGGQLLFRLPGVMVVVWGFSYSSFVSTSTFGTLSWTFIALSAITAYRSSPSAGPPTLARPLDSVVAARPASTRSVLGKA
jgi:hypothetical protein